MILINGKQQNTLPITDRGLHYGDGLFETIEISQRRAVFLRQHLARLKLGCQTLKIPFPQEKLLIEEVSQLAQATESGVLKLILTRGSGGRGYRQPAPIHVTRILALHPYPDYPKSYQKSGIDTFFCNTRLGINPLLAGLKHNNRLEQVIARSEWADEFQEGLMLNVQDHVIEGTMTNLFVIKNRQIFTPKITVSGINGIVRQIIIEMAKAHHIQIKETELNTHFVLSADELFVTNSVIGLWPVKSLQEKMYSVGPLTHRMQGYFSDYKEQDRF